MYFLPYNRQGTIVNNSILWKPKSWKEFIIMKKALNEILTIKECAGMRLLAGQGGLGRLVEWIDLIETPDRIPYSTPNQLIFMTGTQLKSEDEFLQLVKMADEHQQSGVVFSIGGPYWQRTPAIVLEYCDAHDFPFLAIDWSEKISKYTHAIGQYLLTSAERRLSVSSILGRVFSGEISLHNNEEAMAVISQMGISDKKKYQVSVCRISGDSNVPPRTFQIAREQMIARFRSVEKIAQLIVPMDDGSVSIMWKNNASELINDSILMEFRDFSKKIEEEHPGIRIKIGLSNPFTHIENLEEEYRRACMVLRLINSEIQKEKMIYQYNQLGLFQMIADCIDKDYIREFQKENYDTLRVYDEMNHTDFCSFLETYFRCNCNVKKVSETAYLHKNTVLYKLKKIEGILHCDFDNIDDLVNLRLALIIKDLAEDERQQS